MKILLANTAHIGDVILSTTALPALRHAFPDATIGFLVGSWAKRVVEDHTLVDHVHLFDLPSMNRDPISKKARQRRGRQTWHQALKEIRSIGYDVVFDQYSYYKRTMSYLLYQTGIPERVGHFVAKCPFFYNEIYFWDWTLEHIVDNHVTMLRTWGLPDEALATAAPTLLYHTPPELLPDLPPRYLLIHCGVGNPRRRWSDAHWESLVAHLRTLDIPLVLIGNGREEEQRAAALTPPNGYNLAGKYSWRAFLEIMRQASLFLGLESMAGHVAAIYKIPSVLIYGGTAPIMRWRPYSPRSHIVYPPSWKDLYSGSAPTALINAITPEQVFERIQQMLKIYVAR